MKSPIDRACPSGQWLRTIVFGLDYWLRRWYDVREYTHHPQCIFRIELGTADAEFALGDGTVISAGDPLIKVHI
jgi:hypothetical protein